MVRQQSAVAQLVDRRRIHGDEQLGDVARLRERQHPHVGPLEIDQHPRQDLRLGRVGQQARLVPRRIFLVFARTGLVPKQLPREHRAAVERVDDEILGVSQASSGRTPKQKVPREVDAFDVEARPPGDFHVEQGERDGNPRATIEHLVQEAVARIFVLLLVADEAHLVEQVVVQCHHLGVTVGIHIRGRIAGRGRRGGDPASGLAADGIKPIEIGSGVEPGVLDARDHQRRHREIGIGAEGGVCERVNEMLFDQLTGSGVRITKKGGAGRPALKQTSETH